ncbi:MAG: Na/Pi cotransporter family protein [Thermodesulfobacteriota bacterium]|nr:Na/Pi cotransporter family protein [Thermodesulfobacteriota bacterium]
MEVLIFKVLGGLGLFIYGIRIVTDGLQNIAGVRLRKFMETISGNRFIGCAVGTIVTSIIQSSSATTVLVVGFVNAGIMTLNQAVGVIIGANIGTTVTAQIIAFKITKYSLPVIFLGTILTLFAPRRKWRFIGQVLLGFGLVFFGMTTMKDGFAPLRDNPVFLSFFTRFSGEHFFSIVLCVITGTFLTVILQSSSVTVGIVMALASQGLLNFNGSVALILGENIGTTITAQLVSIGGNINARRAANAHTMFNLLGVICILIIFPFFVEFVEWITKTLLNLPAPDTIFNDEKPFIARYIANAHTFFNVLNAFVFIIFMPILVKSVIFISPEKDKGVLDELYKVKYLDRHFINNPPVALHHARQEVKRMGEGALITFKDVINSLYERKLEKLSIWREREDALDILQKEITNYLVKISQGVVTPYDSKEVSNLMRMTNNFERIGDSIENIAELIEEMIENGYSFTEEGLNDYKIISDKVDEFIRLVIDGVSGKDQGAFYKARGIEEAINIMREDMRDKFLDRLRKGTCLVDPGLIFIDMLTNFEKIGDYCFNIAQAMQGNKFE